MTLGARRALVTGGAGFIGSHVVRALLASGVGVTVLDNLSVGTREAVDPAVRLVIGDVRDRRAVEEALEGADCVFHLAAQVTIRASMHKFYEDVDTNLMGTLHLLRCLDSARVQRLILASSMAVYADAPSPAPIPETHPREPISPYGVSKLAAERICSHVLGLRGIEFTALRYFNTFGPGQTYSPYVGVMTIFATNFLRNERPTIFGDGEQRRDFVHVEDITSGTIAALNGASGTYNLGSGRGVSVNELAELLRLRTRSALTPAHAPAQPGELRYSVADISAARTALGYQPRKRLEDEADAVIEFVRSRLG